MDLKCITALVNKILDGVLYIPTYALNIYTGTYTGTRKVDLDTLGHSKVKVQHLYLVHEK